MSLAYVALEKLEEALEACNRAVHLAQQNPLYVYPLGYLYKRTGQLEPAWLLLDTAPDWRWSLNRQNSPWYPSVKIFRQRHANDWSGVFESVRVELAAV